MRTEEKPFDWRAIGPVIFLPSILFAIGQYAVIPVIPALADRVGADLGGAALIASMIVVGHLIGDIPSGVIVAKLGERSAMIAAAGLAIFGVVVAYFAPNPIVLALGILCLGVASAASGLARHAFLTSHVALRHRGRALSALGGSARLGSLIGPFAGAALLALTGHPEAVLWLHAASCTAVVLVLLLLPQPDVVNAASGQPAGQIEVNDEAVGLWRTMRNSRHVLLTVGAGSALVSGLRQARQVVLPVWAASIGLDAVTISIIIGFAGMVDFSLFFVGGWVTDRFGRLWTIMPCAIGLAAGFIVLSFTHDLDTNFAWYIGCTFVLSLANGLGAGILMTLAADLANRRNPAPFLGAWRFVTDFGGAALPMLLTAITALATLPIAVATLGIVGLGGALMMRIYVPRYLSSRPGEKRLR